MSDTPAGPGWWFTSDGKWHPPQEPAPPADQRPWFKKKRFVIPAAVVGLLVIVSATAPPEAEEDEQVTLSAVDSDSVRPTTTERITSTTPVPTTVAPTTAPPTTAAPTTAPPTTAAPTTAPPPPPTTAAPQPVFVEPPPSNCHPSYTPCVPNVAGDLDCGDIGHPVRVIGPDDYGLDRDNDGSGCESS